MTPLAFYAPMKPPTHPVPSGDRAMARALMTVLEHTNHHVHLASDLRIYDKAGDGQLQRKLTNEAQIEILRLIPQGRAQDWRVWVTYHSYYKAPDLIGPAVAEALNIPYLLIEATRASKRLTGPWANFAQAGERACDAAQIIFYLTSRDAEALKRDTPPHQKLVHLRPFLPVSELPVLSSREGPMLSVGMMRAGDKLASYQIVADTLALLPDTGWQLDIVGDGTERKTVANLMAPFGDRIRFLGQLDATQLQRVYSKASFLLWPGVNEAFGLSYLEAQAAGLPVVAQDRPGVSDVLAPGDYPSVADGSAALAANLERLLANPTIRAQRGDAVRAHIEKYHLMSAARDTLQTAIESVTL